MHSRSTSEGSELSRRGTWESTSTLNSITSPDHASFYASKPLPPTPPPPSSARLDAPFSMLDMLDVYENAIPVPKPLNIRKKPTSNPTMAALVVATQNDLQRLETRASSPLPPRPMTPPPMAAAPQHYRQASDPSPSAASRRRTSKKVQQLMGHDIDVMDVPPVVPGPCIAEREPQLDEIRLPEPQSQEEPQFLNPNTYADPSSRASVVSTSTQYLHRLSFEYLMPLLDDDTDEVSSNTTSSWGPSSPEPTLPVLQPTVYGGHENTSLNSLQQTLVEVVSDEEPIPYEFTEEFTAGEYHKFAVQLASESRRKSEDEVVAPPVQRKKRSSSLLRLSAATQFARRRQQRPEPAEPVVSRSSEESLYTDPRPSTAGGAPLASEVEDSFVPKSGWDSDSDDEEAPRSRWRKNRSRKTDGRESPYMNTTRDGRSRVKPSDSMRDLLESAKIKAKSLDRRPRREIDVIPEGVVVA